MTWSMHFVDDTDGLVHHADEGWGTRHIGTKAGVYPNMAYTRCGYLVTWDGFRANAGVYVSRDVHLTCVPCAANARDGRTRRAGLKNAMFAQLYGKNVDNVLSEYTEAERRIMEQYLKKPSVMQRCRQLSVTLYMKALEVSGA